MNRRAESCKMALSNVQFLAGEILNATSSTEKTADAMMDFFAERERINTFISISIDYMNQIEDELQEMIEIGKEG